MNFHVFLIFTAILYLEVDAIFDHHHRQRQLSPEEITVRIETRAKFVDEVNKKARYWKAELNEEFALFDEDMKRMMQGSLLEEWEEGQKFGGELGYPLTPKPLEIEEPELKFIGYANPETFSPIAEPSSENSLDTVCTDFRFDLREKWPQCAHIIGNIRDQSLCSSCYAVSTAAAFSDRHCIALAKVGRPIPEDDSAMIFSAADAMECSKAGSGDACSGGYSSKVWRWFAESGVVTGNNYNSGGCKPYPIPPYKSAVSNSTNCREHYHPSNCPTKCTNLEYSRNYTDDKKFALNYNVLGTLKVPKKIENSSQSEQEWSWEQTMKEELFNNGSITVDYRIFDDFFDYPKSGGVYQHTDGDELNPHVVRVIGYGRVNCSDETSVKYWLVANSWSAKWGDNGLFRIARGVDECGIESRQIGFGTPKI